MDAQCVILITDLIYGVEGRSLCLRPSKTTEFRFPSQNHLHLYGKRGTIQNLRDLAKTLKQVAHQALLRGELFSKIPDQRLAVCSTCEYFIIQDSKCQKCGCNMKIKVQFQAAQCPIQKW